MNRQPRPSSLLPPVLVLLLLLSGAGRQVSRAADKVTAWKGELEIPTYPWTAVKHPYFRGTDKVNIYPYPMLDFLSREKAGRAYRTVVLENEFLRITFLPELGGKIHEVIDKTTGQPMFYVNHVIKPGLIGQCGAWTSGGVEWNTGPQGHTVSCMQPVEVEILPPGRDGSRSVAVGETERIYGTRWTVVVTLRPGRSFIEERIRIYNPTTTIRPYYFWNCTAAPNTPGFRFIYPMTLGCDHAGETFFQWPVDQGKDLTRGTNYQDASSIFAWHCDQDFFGSYNDDLDRGAVSYANHHQLPGKKAWTWGQGGFGKMHQMDLTDNDGPYNEVQTGPLLTQAQVGRLDPCEAVEWREWWYPVHAIGGFTFATKDLAVNAELQNSRLRLRMLGTGNWREATVIVHQGDGTVAARDRCRISPRDPTELNLTLPASTGHPEVEVIAGGTTLARFAVPLRLPARKPPEGKAKPEAAAALAQAGWEDFLFAREAEAEARFRQALGKDSCLVEARTGLALLLQSRDPEAAYREADAALAAAPDNGLAHLALAAASLSRDERRALEHAWKAALDPATAVPGRALAARLLLRSGQWRAVTAALSEPGPWETDSLCRNRRAYAEFMLGGKTAALELVRAALETDPLDAFALSLQWLMNDRNGSRRLMQLAGGKALIVLELAREYAELGQPGVALRILREFYLDQVPSGQRDPLPDYWARYLSRAASESTAGKAARPRQRSDKAGAGGETKSQQAASQYAVADAGFPHHAINVEVLRDALRRNPVDKTAALYLGHVLFSLGRHAEGREMWKLAAGAGGEPVVAYRALGMAAKTLDNDLATARHWLAKASQADPKDAIVSRDLANVLFSLADKAETESARKDLTTQARDLLRNAFEAGQGRSDFVALLARAQNRLGDYAASAAMLDHVRVTIWEGAHEVHDLFVQAHMALGETCLSEGRPADALREFNRALEYPENLATGRLENAREAHIQYQRGNALKALGQEREAIAAWKLAADEPESKDARIEEARQKAQAMLRADPDRR
jgi:tetratricopeptide (TPR) repeat protein